VEGRERGETKNYSWKPRGTKYKAEIFARRDSAVPKVAESLPKNRSRGFSYNLRRTGLTQILEI
jgi:hypothetical protein